MTNLFFPFLSEVFTFFWFVLPFSVFLHVYSQLWWGFHHSLLPAVLELVRLSSDSLLILHIRVNLMYITDSILFFFCCWEADVDSQIHSLPFHALWRMMNTSKEWGMLMYFHQERCYQFPGSQRDDSPWWWWLTIDGFSSREDALQQSIKMFPVIR